MSELVCECGKKFKNKSGFSIHKKYCESVNGEVSDKYFCECGDGFKSKSAFKTHQNYCEESDRKGLHWTFEKVECPECGDMVAKPQLKKHKNSKSCKSGGTFETLLEKGKSYKVSGENFYDISTSDFEKVEKGYKCFECGEVYCENGITSHYWYNHTEKGNEHRKICGERFQDKNGEIWNKGLTEEDHPSVKKAAQSQREYYEENDGVWVGKTHKTETKEKISETISEKLRNDNFHKKEDVKNIEGEKFGMDSGFEIKFANWLNQNKYIWAKDKKIKYKDENQVRHYIPDFYLPNFNIYFEVKGYVWPGTKEKMRYVLNQNDIKLYYVLKDHIEKLSNYKKIERLKKELPEEL